jgi:UrcA family protein
MMPKFDSGRASRSLILLFGLLAGPAMLTHAATPDDVVPYVVVKYGDLNLSTEEGNRTIYRRIIAAARQVCPDEGSRDLQAFAISRACRDAAIARAVAAVPSRRLAELHAMHNKRA